MSFLAGITTITVTGAYLAPDGVSPAAGSVLFTPSVAAVSSGVVLPVTPLVVDLDAYGAFSVDLAATDDVDWTPVGFTYLVTERIQGAQPRSYSIAVPSASPGGVLDLATVVPVVAAQIDPSVTVQDAIDYLREGGASWLAADIQDALDAETAAQRTKCRIPDPMPADLAQALKRRVQRNLAMRQLPLAVLQGDAEGGSTRILPSNDPEVRRLEAPYRRLKVG